jgi:hypothetical protein
LYDNNHSQLVQLELKSSEAAVNAVVLGSLVLFCYSIAVVAITFVSSVTIFMVHFFRFRKLHQKYGTGAWLATSRHFPLHGKLRRRARRPA